MDEQIIVFVYGTLKRGFNNHRRFLSEGKFLGTAETEPLYRLYDCGPYPCMVADEKNGVSVRGELFEINDKILQGLDYLEGVPHLYQRFPLKIKGESRKVQGYLFQRGVGRFDDCGAEWPPA